MTWPNKQAYCTKHGYQLFDSSNVLDNSRPPSWSKIKAAQRLFSLKQRDNQSPLCEWVVWWDADTVIMNSDKKIQNLFPLHADFVVTKQKSISYNAGAWIIKNTPWSHQFLQTWWDMEHFVRVKGLSVSGDNDALFHYLTQDMPKDEFEKHVVVPPRCTFNSVTKWVTPSQAIQYQKDPSLVQQEEWYLHEEYYHQGDLIAHVAGTYPNSRSRTLTCPTMMTAHTLVFCLLACLLAWSHRSQQQD
jgi:mannan polymerase II complex MNN10 subunit